MSGKSCTSFFLTLLTAALMLAAPLQYGYCDEPQWRSEFDEACKSTSDAMALSVPDLKLLIAKCDQLQKTIEKLDETTRKVFLKRLLMCRNLYQFVLETKEQPAGTVTP